MKGGGFALEKVRVFVSPQKDGGLNFRDLQTFNRALVVKMVWCVLTSPNLRVLSVLKRKYLSDAYLLSLEAKRSSSYFLRSLLWGRDLLKLGLRKRVGFEESINVFEDPWIPRPLTFKVFSLRLLRTIYWFLTSLPLLSNGMWIRCSVFCLKMMCQVILEIPINQCEDQYS